ncbi:hypothetical protein CPB86DRAFT_815278 [Serendipita vermifera]|nr:hypothetical protein CPB86DRAFT_815278 [Serendipita vermifera]
MKGTNGIKCCVEERKQNVVAMLDTLTGLYFFHVICLVSIGKARSFLALCDHYAPSRQHALDLEQQLGTDVDSNPDFDSVSRLDLFAMASFYLLTSPSIVALHDGGANRYRCMFSTA